MVQKHHILTNPKMSANECFALHSFRLFSFCLIIFTVFVTLLTQTTLSLTELSCNCLIPKTNENFIGINLNANAIHIHKNLILFRRKIQVWFVSLSLFVCSKNSIFLEMFVIERQSEYDLITWLFEKRHTTILIITKETAYIF